MCPVISFLGAFAIKFCKKVRLLELPYLFGCIIMTERVFMKFYIRGVLLKFFPQVLIFVKIGRFDLRDSARESDSVINPNNSVVTRVVFDERDAYFLTCF